MAIALDGTKYIAPAPMRVPDQKICSITTDRRLRPNINSVGLRRVVLNDLEGIDVICGVEGVLVSDVSVPKLARDRICKRHSHQLFYRRLDSIKNVLHLRVEPVFDLLQIFGL